MLKLKQVKDSKAFYALFVKDMSFWFLDCSSWNKQEMLIAFHEDTSSLFKKRLVKLPNDSEDTIKKARRYLTTRNTKTFVDLTNGELD